MGVVYKAQDLRLDRLVALKFLPRDFGANEQHRQRFIQEAKAASALDHPNICTIHEIDQAPDGQMFIAMAYYQGETLKSKIDRGRLGIEEAAGLALQVAQGLAKAHGQGLVHRDIKPANVIVTTDGVAKILDFGLAKVSGETELTRTGTTLGTASYMAPEQAQGEHVDARADLWSLGVVLYEMLAGERPFRGESMPAVIHSVLYGHPKSLREVRPETPAEVVRVVTRAMEKDPRVRYASAAEMAQDLAAWSSQVATVRPLDLRNPRVAVPAVAALVALAAVLGWLGVRNARARWAREKALPEITRLSEKGSRLAAFDLARQAAAYIPSDPQVARLWPEVSRTVLIETTPPGAEVFWKEYADPKGAWRPVGQSPLQNIRVPLGYLRWRATKPGYEPVEVAAPRGFAPGGRLVLKLHTTAETPPGMVWVPPGNFSVILAHFGRLGPVEVEGYWIDKYEVTNRQFKEFVDRGGYQKPEYWKHPFVKDGKSLSFQEATALFRDSTGRPGPATWEAGVFPEGKDDVPVTGVSWHEASAYAEFAGKQLPTVYHWYQAAGIPAADNVVPQSNFGSSGPARAGTYPGISPYGAYDMAGNVKEWCWNETGGRRFALGGAWNEVNYMFWWAESRSPFDRAASDGLRLVKYSGPVSENLRGPLRPLFRDYNKEKPVSEEVFRIFRSMYAAEPVPLEARSEPGGPASEFWSHEKVSFNAGAAKERMTASLLVPKGAKPPFQALIFFPGSNALFTRSRDDLLPGTLARLDFLVKTGRVLMLPSFKGTYERQIGLATQQQNREVVAQWVKDLGAAVDYLESRPDIDRNAIGYLGTSMGARVGAMLAPFEPRLKTMVMCDGGFSFLPRTPEVDEINFAPRVKTPVLMLNGRYDFIFPAETSQVPMFRLLGSPEKDKKYVVLDTAHDVLSIRGQAVREVLDWLDRYLGPVR